MVRKRQRARWDFWRCMAAILLDGFSGDAALGAIGAPRMNRGRRIANGRRRRQARIVVRRNASRGGRGERGRATTGRGIVGRDHVLRVVVKLRSVS